jgi:hypothetical protein
MTALRGVKRQRVGYAGARKIEKVTGFRAERAGVRGNRSQLENVRELDATVEIEWPVFPRGDLSTKGFVDYYEHIRIYVIHDFFDSVQADVVEE